MNMGDFGNFSRWSAKNKVLSKMIYDEAKRQPGKKGNGHSNAGCLSVLALLLVAVALVLLFTHLPS